MANRSTRLVLTAFVWRQALALTGFGIFTLLALAVDGIPQLGVVTAPALGKRWWAATGHGAWTQELGGEPRRLAVSTVGELSDASQPRE